MEKEKTFSESVSEVYKNHNTLSGENMVAAAILVLAEAIKYHADVTAPPLPYSPKLETFETMKWPNEGENAK